MNFQDYLLEDENEFLEPEDMEEAEDTQLEESMKYWNSYVLESEAIAEEIEANAPENAETDIDVSQADTVEAEEHENEFMEDSDGVQEVELESYF